jgi:hypothetical protein
MGRRIKKWDITGEVVPPGSLAPNPYNPSGRLTPEERWNRFCDNCADIIVDACSRAKRSGEASSKGQS